MSDQPPYPPAQPDPAQQQPGPYQSQGNQAPYAYGQTIAPQPKGLAITALVLGIASVVFIWFPLFGIPLGIAAIIFGIVALRKQQHKGFSLTGIITGGVGLLGSVIVAIVTALIVAASLQAAGSAGSAFEEISESYASQDSTEHEVRYVATTSAGQATVTYGTSAELSDADITDAAGLDESSSFVGADVATVSVIGDVSATDQQLSCEIFIDGASVDAQQGTTTVTCLADTFDY